MRRRAMLVVAVGLCFLVAGAAHLWAVELKPTEPGAEAPVRIIPPPPETVYLHLESRKWDRFLSSFVIDKE